MLRNWQLSHCIIEFIGSGVDCHHLSFNEKKENIKCSLQIVLKLNEYIYAV